jgi:SAM-dependent methyltransferase
LGVASARTQHLYDRYYGDRLDLANGTARFHALCLRFLNPSSRVLEIGAGPSNETSRFLSGNCELEGVDVSMEVLQNDALRRANVYDGGDLPFADGVFDVCVSNYVLEHVSNPARHFHEVRRVLKPGGKYIFRTPNLYHYVALVSRVLPHSLHKAIANRVRSLSADAHEPWPTVYRANSKSALERLAATSVLEVECIDLIEPDPSYGRASALLFYPMLGYERLVNSTELLSGFRANILGVLAKK